MGDWRAAEQVIGLRAAWVSQVGRIRIDAFRGSVAVSELVHNDGWSVAHNHTTHATDGSFDRPPD
jgi:hypothetical protein